MKEIVFLTGIFLLTGLSSNAQQRIDPKGMSYLVSPKPNTIIFHDTVYSGKKQFEYLFYRTHDQELINLFEKHQSNKIAGQVLGIAGTVATIFGISKLSGSSSEKGLGWGLLGGGFAATLTGGYLTLMGQRNLLMAVTLFNQRYHLAALGVGVSNNQVGLVYKF
jgi:hypothetical protein